MRDFYATVAQVLPVLLLAFVWDSRFLDNLRRQRRAPRRDDPVSGVLFWTKKRVRVYALTVSTVLVTDLAVCLMVLMDLLPDFPATRAIAAAGLLLALVTLLTRIWVDIIHATRSPHRPDSPDSPRAFRGTVGGAEDAHDRP